MAHESANLYVTLLRRSIQVKSCRFKVNAGESRLGFFTEFPLLLYLEGI
jgi:hypothetical protein